MPVSSISGSTKSHRGADSVKLGKSELKADKKQKHKVGPAPADELLLSTKGKKLGHAPAATKPAPTPPPKPHIDPVVTDPIINTDDNGTDVTVSTPDVSGDSAGTTTVVQVVSADLTALLDRLDALTKKQNDLSNAVASFEQLALDFEGRIGKFEHGDGPAVRGQLQIEGLSLNNINIALKFARRGFDVVSLLQSTAGPKQSNGLKNISESLNRGLEALKNQTKYLSTNMFGEQNSVAELFSNNLGTALNQTV